MANITDIIEEYIKARLGRSSGGAIIFRRGELAEKLTVYPHRLIMF